MKYIIFLWLAINGLKFPLIKVSLAWTEHKFKAFPCRLAFFFVEHNYEHYFWGSFSITSEVNENIENISHSDK